MDALAENEYWTFNNDRLVAAFERASPVPRGSLDSARERGPVPQLDLCTYSDDEGGRGQRAHGATLESIDGLQEPGVVELADGR